MKFTSPSGTKNITLQAGESLDIHLEDFEDGSRSFNLNIYLKGDKATCNISGRIQSKNNDKKQWSIIQHFQGENQTGNIEVRGTGEDQGFVQCDAQGILEQSSIDATANISERVILFDQAKSKLLPVLTVKTDKVEAASHGATVAPVEPEKILYAMSKGLSRTQAEEQIKEGFLK